MKKKTRRPTHPGTILDEHYIIPLKLNLQELADHLGISRNTLFKIRTGLASITPSIAISLAEAFDTSPQLWLNLQQKHDIWNEQYIKEHRNIKPIFKSGVFFPIHSNRRRTNRIVT